MGQRPDFGSSSFYAGSNSTIAQPTSQDGVNGSEQAGNTFMGADPSGQKSGWKWMTMENNK